MNSISKNDSGVSPMIGLLFMLMITILMSTVVLVIALSFRPPEMTPISAIVAGPFLETQEIQDIMITHKGGDGLDAGSWSISIVPANKPPSFKKLNVSFTVGYIIISQIQTDGGGNYSVNNGILLSEGIATGLNYGEKYHVQIRDNPRQGIIMDKMVIVR